MALTIIEQLKLINGTLKPPSTSLDALVHQASYNYAKSFYDTVKDTTGNAEADSYATKVFNVAKRVLRNEQGVTAILTRMIITIIGASSATLAQVTAATDAQWEAFIVGQMDETFEYVGDVKKEEKLAYNAI